ncbi:MAG: YraN family protein [Paracoccaceae bacterium]|nr:YraN family protein [Paracoccaceae bacterium]
MRGRTAYEAGLAAEDQVSAHYRRSGHELAASRWRGRGGEIDLVMRRGDELVFVEVKKAGSLHDAAFRLTARQLRRLYDAASEFLSGQPLGLLTPLRFDLALVGGAGEIEIVENVMLT